MSGFDESKVRRERGKFANKDSMRDEAGQVDLELDLTDFQRRFAAVGYIPRDPDTPRLQDRLDALDSEPLTHDNYGNSLERGFPRTDSGAALVSNPHYDGSEPRAYYGSPSSSGVASSSYALENHNKNSIARAWRDKDFARWADDQYDRIDPDDPDWTEDAVTERVRIEAEHAGKLWLRADRGTYLHWVAQRVNEGRDYHVGRELGAELGFRAGDDDAFADAYRTAMFEHGIRPLMNEVTCVNDIDRKAGTADQLVVLDKPMHFDSPEGRRYRIDAGTRLIADIKTGRSYGDEQPKYRGRYAAQLAVYADSVPYDIATASRGHWPDHIAPSRTHGLIVQCDSDTVLSGSPDVKVEVVALSMGREYVAASTAVKQAERRADGAAVHALKEQP